jgi:predicted nucleic acid-binding protein
VTVLDTSILIDLLRQVPAARDYLLNQAAVPTCSEITRVEVLQGLRSPERQAAESLFAALSWADVDEAISRRAGELGRRYRRSHPGLAVADLVIAATALELDQPLATLNVRHFPIFPRLRPPY